MRGAATQAMSLYIVEERQRSRCPPAAAPFQAAARRPAAKCQVILARALRHGRVRHAGSGIFWSRYCMGRLTVIRQRIQNLTKFLVLIPLFLPSGLAQCGCPPATVYPETSCGVSAAHNHCDACAPEQQVDREESIRHQNCCSMNSDSPIGLASPMITNPNALKDLSPAESPFQAATPANVHFRDVAWNGTSPPDTSLHPLYQLLSTLRI